MWLICVGKPCDNEGAGTAKKKIICLTKGLQFVAGDQICTKFPPRFGLGPGTATRFAFFFHHDLDIFPVSPLLRLYPAKAYAPLDKHSSPAPLPFPTRYARYGRLIDLLLIIRATHTQVEFPNQSHNCCEALLHTHISNNSVSRDGTEIV